MPPKKSSRRRTKSRRPMTKSIEHLHSSVLLAVDLKSAHKKQEYYPIDLNQLISRANVGPDAQIKLIGYRAKLSLATGNNTNTVTVSIGHRGPWVRPAQASDGFNQQFPDHSFNKSGCAFFHKRVLQESERAYLDPDDGNNSIVLRMRDPCGVIPGATVLIQFEAHLVRRVIDTVFMNSDEMATDKYEDQDVSTGAPRPPTQRNDIPSELLTISNPAGVVKEFPLKTSAHPQYTYGNDSFSDPTFTVTVTGVAANTINKVGDFRFTSTSSAASEYTNSGYVGVLTNSSFV